MKKIAIVGIFVFSVFYSFLSHGQQVSRALQYGAEFRDNAAIGRIGGISVVNKFAIDNDLDTIDGEVTIWELGTRLVPMTTAETFTITYNNSTDGAGTTGARTLYFSYSDSNRAQQVAVHTLGSSGSDVTSFSGLGINRIAVSSAGTAKTNNNAITVTNTTTGNNQAYIPSGTGVTQQCFYFSKEDAWSVADYLLLNTQKTGGGASPVVTFKGYVHDFGTATKFLVFQGTIDTRVDSVLQVQPSWGFPFVGSALLEFTAQTNTNDTTVNCRFSLADHDDLQ